MFVFCACVLSGETLKLWSSDCDHLLAAATDWLYLQFTDKAMLSRLYGSVVVCMLSHAFLQWIHFWWGKDRNISDIPSTQISLWLKWGRRNKSNWQIHWALCMRLSDIHLHGPKSNFSHDLHSVCACVCVFAFVCVYVCVSVCVRWVKTGTTICRGIQLRIAFKRYRSTFPSNMQILHISRVLKWELWTSLLQSTG